MILVLVLALASLAWVGATFAQSTKPSTPVFTARVVHSSIEFKITNQPFTNSSTVNAISYNMRVKDPTTGYWVEIYADSNYDLQSNGTYTILSMPIGLPNVLPHSLQNASSVDFQMQAQTGYYERTYKQGQMPGAPFPTDGYWYYNFNAAEKSDWSPTKTVDLTAGTSSTPTIPELSWIAVLPLLAFGLVAAAIVQSRKKLRIFD